MSRLLTFLLQHAAWLMAGVILLGVLLWVPAFQQQSYWVQLSHQYFAAAALALALMPIILTGGIDLSVGSVAVLASVVVGALTREAGLPIGWAMAGGMLAGLVAGLINGGLVTLGVLPLVATLATRELFRGLALTLSGEKAVVFRSGLREFWRTPVAGLPLPLYVIGLLSLLTHLAVHHTWIGRMLYALGDNEQAARFAGVPVRRLKLGLYAWSGLLAGVCGATLVMKYSTAKPDAEKYLELTAIACVVVGGVRITGGAGSVAGTLLGIVTVATLLAGLSDAWSEWRDTLLGTLLVAVALGNEAASRWAARRRARELQAAKLLERASS